MGIDFYGAKTFMMDPRLSVDLIPPERVSFSSWICHHLLERKQRTKKNMSVCAKRLVGRHKFFDMLPCLGLKPDFNSACP